MESLERLLKEHAFLRDLDDEQLRFMVGCARNLRFDAGAFLLREGGEADQLLLVRRGRVALEVHAPDRGAVQMESLGDGDIVGLSWLAPPFRWQLDARAVEPTVALAFDARCLRAKMDAEPRFGYALATRLLAAVVQRLARVRLQRLDVYGLSRAAP
jgi:CRP/FNR family cyclic AMP-dependent transcriptional regulator